jgi:hypothetical protein
MTHCKRMMLGIAMSLLFPVLLVLGLAAAIIVAVGAAIVGLFYGPYMVM